MSAEYSDFDVYQGEAITFDSFPRDQRFHAHLFGLSGECGEVSELVKKAIRDGSEGRDLCEELAYELGDVLWYLSAIASDVGYRLSDIAVMNIRKLEDRKKRGKISGSGDHR